MSQVFCRQFVKTGVTRSSIRGVIAAGFLVLPLAVTHAQVVGPVYPPPSTNIAVPSPTTETVTFGTNGGDIGHGGGVQWTFSGIGVATAARTWWGPGPVYPDSTPSSYIFEYNTTPFTFTSSTTNTAVYTTPPWPYTCVNNGNFVAVYQRFTMTYSSSSPITLDTAATAGVSDTNNRVGVLLRVTPGMTFSVNMLFEASFDGNTWTPGITFFDNPCFNHPVSGFPTNFQGGFYYINSAPTLGTLSNQTVYLSSSGSATPVGPLTFTIADDGDPNQVTFANIASSNQNAVANGSITVVNNGNGTGSISFIALPQAYGTQGTTQITFNGVDGLGASSVPNGFSVLIDQPPFLDTNTPLTVGQGAGSTVTQSLLHATDPDTSNPAIFQVQGQPHTGTLYLNGTASPASFTQTDVNNGLVTYTNNNSCQTSDNFQFQVFDSDGGFANDPVQGPGATTYSFGINVTLTQTAPTAQPASLQTGLGASVSSTAHATSTDCGPPAITYQFGTPAHGSLSNTDASTGAFTYTPNLGYSGTDSFTFTGTTYGSMVSTPATVSITVQNQAPTAQPATLVTHVNTLVTGNLVATDPDLPAQTLKYAVATGPTHGQLIITNATTGAFTYIPNSGFGGNDAFTFTANDGSLTSAPASVAVQVRQYPKPGAVLITDQGSPASVILFDPVSSQQSILSDDPLLKQPYGIVVRGNGNILVTDGGPNGGPGYMLDIDPNSGTAGQFGPDLPTSIGLALEANGNVLVSLTNAFEVARFDGVTGNVTGTPMSLGANTAPTGIAVASDGTLWVDNAGVFNGGTNDLYHMNADGSSPTSISTGNYLNPPAGIALTSTTAYVSTIGPFAGGAPTNIVAVDLTTGTQTLVSADGNLVGAPGLAIASSGHLYVTSIGNASIVDVDPANGDQVVLAQNGLLQAPWDLTIVPPAASGVDLSVTMTAPSGYIKETKPLVYTIVVHNFGPDGATGATISAVTPPNVTGLTWTCTTNGSGSCTANGTGSLNDTMNVPVGAVLTYTVTATASVPETFTIYTVSVQAASGITDVNPNNNTATSGLPEKIFTDGFGP